MYTDKEIIKKYTDLIKQFNKSGCEMFVSLEHYILNRYEENPTQLMYEVWQYCLNDY